MSDDDFKLRELALKERELDLKEKEIAAPRRGLTAPQATALAALVGLVSGLAGGWLTLQTKQLEGQSAIDLEDKRSQIQLILNAVKVERPQEALPFLKFYADMKFIPQYEDKIREYLEQDTTDVIRKELIPVTVVSKVTSTTSSTTSASQATQTPQMVTEDLIKVGVKDLCERLYKDNTPAGVFVNSVARNLGVPLPENEEKIVEEIQTGKWEKLQNGIVAAERARRGDFVVAGLLGAKQATPKEKSLVVVVVDGPLASGKYPSAYWTNPLGPPGRFKTINWGWTAADRDNVIYATIPLAIGPSGT